jgi:hypothetical protein
LKIEKQISNKITSLALQIANYDNICTEKKLKPLNDLIEEFVDGLEHDRTDTKARKFFKGMTKEDLEKLWNKSDPTKRIEILEMGGDSYTAHIDKLDSYGGWRSAELESQILDDKFGECEWLDSEAIEQIFGEYLEESKD